MVKGVAPDATPPSVSASARKTTTRIARASGAMTAFTALSRLTGFARIVIVTGVLGTTALGNTYETANTIPNILFELVAAGALQAVLIPTLVELFDRGDHDEADRLAGSVLGLGIALLAALAALTALAAPLVVRVLFSGVGDPAVRADQVRLGTVFLWFFLPQVLFYVVGTVATAVLNARHRFALPTAAPIVNNVIVTACYGLFLWTRDGAPPSLHLTPLQVVVLAGGTTLGVVGFCAVPLLAARRLGHDLRPRFAHRDPAVRRVLRLGAWAMVELASTQVLLGVVLILANRAEGGVVAYQAAYSYFLLPHALFVLPIVTALFPTLARTVQQGDEAGYRRQAAQGLRAISFVVLPAVAALCALGPMLARSVLVGHVHNGGVQMVGDTVVAFGPGLFGYGVFVYSTRLLYARNDTRLPALCNLAVVAATSLAMVVVAMLVPRQHEVPSLAWVQSGGYSIGAIALWRFATRRTGVREPFGVLTAVARSVVCATVAGAVMAWLVAVGPWGGRAGGLLGVLVCGTVGLAVYLFATVLGGGPTPASFVRLVKGGEHA